MKVLQTALRRTTFIGRQHLVFSDTKRFASKARKIKRDSREGMRNESVKTTFEAIPQIETAPIQKETKTTPSAFYLLGVFPLLATGVVAFFAR
mmetsp:Transcript_10596/g.15482  ORF Transcript_10596/g.15482 Transcript_10596/m.15482 type:complete len:93 (+) Transcript_10596:110-388(+)